MMNILLKKYKQLKGLLFFFYINNSQRLRVLSHKSIYHVIGDSHTTCFQHQAFIIHHIGPSTAFRLNYKNSTTRGREKVIKIINNIYNKREINVIVVFGELDVRIHINKAANEKRISVDKVIDSTVKSYFNFLKYIKYKYPLIKIYVFNILPQGEEKNIYNYPYYASRNKKSDIAVAMNNKLKLYSEKEEFKFIYIYDKLIDKRGNRKKEYVFDDVHFNRRIMKFVLEELK